MSVALQGIEGALAQVWADGAVEAIYCGDVQVWPELSTGGGILVELPTDALWLHAVAASELVPATESSYLKFTVDGVDYYVNKAPNGKQLVTLEGNVLRLTPKQKAALIGKVGDSLVIKARYPARKTHWKAFSVSPYANNRFYMTWYLPLLAGTYFYVDGYKKKTMKFDTSTGEVSFNYARVTLDKVTSHSSGKVITFNRVAGQVYLGAYTFWVSTREVTKSEVVASDLSFTLSYNVLGAAESMKGIAPVWPALEKEFEIKVLGVY